MLVRKLRNLKVSLNCFRTATKVLVFESDDWGTNRMPSRGVYDDLAAAGLIDPDYAFNKCGRETIEDLDMLYAVLAKFRDAEGRPPVFTMNFVMANPDYEAIERSGFQDYFYIAIDDVVRCPERACLIGKYQEGIGRGLIQPQYHGRDHFGAESWLAALRGGDPIALAGFRRGVPLAGDSYLRHGEYMRYDGKSLMPLPCGTVDDKIRAGLDMFERVFGFRPLTSVAPFYEWFDAVEACLYRHGVRGMQAAGHRLPRRAGDDAACHGSAVLGHRRTSGMVCLIRNCWFRPTEVGEAGLGSCIREVATAFAHGHPAVIDTHRVNFIGVVDPAVRHKNLGLLSQLLHMILKAYPDVHFATSEDLAHCVLGDNNDSSDSVDDGGPRIRRASVGRRALFAARERLWWWRQGRRSVDGPSRSATP